MLDLGFDDQETFDKTAKYVDSLLNIVPPKPIKDPPNSKEVTDKTTQTPSDWNEPSDSK